MAATHPEHTSRGGARAVSAARVAAFTLRHRFLPAALNQQRHARWWLTQHSPVALPELWRLFVGAMAVLLPGLLLAVLAPDLPVSTPGIVLMVAVAIATYLADWTGGFTALLFAAVLLDLLFISDRSSFSLPHDSTEAGSFAVTLTAGAVVIWLIERIKRESSDARLDAAAARAAASALAAIESPATQAPGNPIDLDAALTKILTAMIRTSRAHAGTLWLTNDDETLLIREASYGLGQEGRAPTVLQLGEGFAGQVALERRPIMSPNLPADPRFLDHHLRAAGVHGVLGVPLISDDDRLLGVAQIGLLVPHRFSATDIARLQALSQRAVAWLESARASGQRELLLRRAQEEQRRLQMIIAAMPEAVVIATPPDGRVVAFNGAAERLLGSLANESEVPEALTRLRRPDGEQPDGDELPLIRALTTGEVATGVELVVHGANDTEIPVLASAAPLRERNGEIVAVVGVFQDIAPLKEAARVKDEFVSVVSHELRSPLTPIRGFVQLVARDLEREGNHATHVTWLHSIEGHVDRMTRLVDDLLDVSRLRAGRLEIRPETTDLVAMCNEIVRSRRSSAPEHELVIATAPPALIGQWDADRIHQVIDNLVSNAIKYSPAGGKITVSLTEDTQHEPAMAQIVVTDQGSGVPPEDRPHIFSAFYRSDEATSSRIAGLGLGLFICRQLIAAHGGTISVDDAPGGGAAFIVRLPIGHRDLITPFPPVRLTA